MSEKYDIQVGDRVTFENLEGNVVIMLIKTNAEIPEILDTLKSRKVLKIERPKYEKVYEKKEILDEAEKEYLSNVIKPFRNKVKFFEKCNTREEQQYLDIYIEDNGYIVFPEFEENSMYKGMELNKQYTLKELGLDK